MEDPAKKELIKGIAELFENYEETYVPGEWESFSQTRKRKYPFFSSWVRIAALLFLLLSVLLFQRIDFSAKNKKNEVVAINEVNHGGKSKPEIRKPHLPAISSSLPKPGMKARPYTVPTGNILPVTARNKVPEPARLAEEIQDSTIVKAENLNYAALDEKNQVADIKPPDSIASKRNTADFLRDETKTTKLAASSKKEEEDKWNFGVEVMPAVSNSSLNIGAGLTTAYRLSKHFSLSSGVSILQMQAGGTVPAALAGQQVKSSLAPKQLTAVDANISAIDIPIGLVYNVNKNFYTSIGVSYFNVISEKRNNTYLTPLGTQSDSPVSSPSAYLGLKSEAVEEPVPDRPLKGNSYLGFFNFSVGRQQHIFDGHQILIEPFIKIPVGKLSSQDLQLINSGVKFKLSF